MQQDTKPLLSAKNLADRWGKHPETIPDYVRAGIIKPVFTVGKQMSFALADVLRIEAGHHDQPGHDLTMPALSTFDRTNPVTLTRRVGLVRQAVEAASAVQVARGIGATREAKDGLRLVAASLRCLATGGTAARVPAPAWGPSEARGLSVMDATPKKVLELATSALTHLLMSSEARETISDFGPLAKQRFLMNLEQLEGAIDQVNTH